MPSHHDMEVALTFIRECLAVHGDKGAEVARARYATVPKTTWNRWMKSVRSEALMSSAPPAPSALAPVVPALPSVPSDDSYTGVAGEFRRHIDIAFDASDAMLAQGLRVDPATGQRKVVNPMLITNSTRMRVMAAAELAKHEERLNSIEENKRRVAEYNARVADVVCEAISGFDREIGRRVVVAVIEGMYKLRDEIAAEMGVSIPGGAGSGRYLFTKSEPTLTRVRDNRVVPVQFHDAQVAAIERGELTYQEAYDQKEP